MTEPRRRQLLVLALGGTLLPAAEATPEAMAAAIDGFAAGRAPRDGRVTLAIDALVENGNTVPVSVSVDSPMSAAEHVQRIAILTPGNPLPEVAVFHLSPRNGRATVSTRMRMATSQRITALAVMNDGSVWRHAVDVVVTLAACIEGG